MNDPKVGEAVMASALANLTRLLCEFEGKADPHRVIAVQLFVCVESLAKVSNYETAADITLKALELVLPDGALRRVEVGRTAPGVH